MEFVFVQLLTGLASASSLFLVASGLTLVFGVTRIVNFAHGSLTMLGAYLGWTLLSALPRDPLWFAAGVLGAAAATGVIGVLIETLLLRRIYRAPELFQLLATFGVVLMIQDITLATWGADDRTISRPPWLRGSVTILGERFPQFDLFLIAVGPIVLGLLWLLLTRTRWGRLVRAATQDREMVGALGVNEKLLFTSVFFLGACLAGLGGALMLPSGSANLQMDLALIAEAFVVVVVGGMGSVTGAYLAALLITVLQAFGILIFPKATLVIVFAIMAVVLVLRPYGLLGRPLAAMRGPGESFAPIRPASPGLVLAGAALVAAAAALPFLAGPYALSVATEALVFVLFAASLHVMMGPGGMPSFGHAAWFGIGAYAAAWAAQGLVLPMAGGLLLGALLAGVVALGVALVVVRLAGVYMAMLTMAFAQIVWAAAFQSVEITGGDNGILGIRPPDWAATPAALYWLALLLCLGGALLLRRILFAPFGYALRASRDSALRAEAIGLPVYHLRAAAFALAGAASGLAGAFYAYAKGSVFPTYVSIPKSVDALVMVLLGGVQTMAGPIVGALAYTGIYDTLLRATDYWRFALGLVIVALVLAFPQGIAGAAQRLWQRRLP